MAAVGAPGFVYSLVRDSDRSLSVNTILKRPKAAVAFISYRQHLRLSLLRPHAFSFRHARGHALP